MGAQTSLVKNGATNAEQWLEILAAAGYIGGVAQVDIHTTGWPQSRARLFFFHQHPGFFSELVRAQVDPADCKRMTNEAIETVKCLHQAVDFRCDLEAFSFPEEFQLS